MKSEFTGKSYKGWHVVSDDEDDYLSKSFGADLVIAIYPKSAPGTIGEEDYSKPGKPGKYLWEIWYDNLVAYGYADSLAQAMKDSLRAHKETCTAAVSDELYHLSAKKFSSFKQQENRSHNTATDAGFHFGSKDTAMARASQIVHGDDHDWKKGQPLYLYKVKLSAHKPLHLSENRIGAWAVLDILAAIFEQYETSGVPGITDEIYDQWCDDVWMVSGENAKEDITYSLETDIRNLKTWLKQLGYDSISYDNTYEGGGESYMVLDPKQIQILDVEEIEIGEKVAASSKTKLKREIKECQEFIKELRNMQNPGREDKQALYRTETRLALLENELKPPLNKAKEKALKAFDHFLNRLENQEDFITAYTKPKITTSKNEVVFTAQGVDKANPKDPWLLYIAWKKETNNMFYYRDYQEGSYQTQQQFVKAKGDESLAVLLTKLLRKI